MATPEQFGAALVLGFVYGIVAWRSKRDDGEPFQPKKLARTLILYLAAAVVIVGGGGQVTPDALNAEAQVFASGFLGTLFDIVWPKIGRPLWDEITGA